MIIPRGYADWAGGQVHYHRAGRGEAIVLLGGAPRAGGQFDPVVDRLAATGFDAIAPDMPGFGLSDPMPADATMLQIAAFLPELLDRLGIGRAHLFGLHSGGKIAAAAAAGWPDRFASLVIAGKKPLHRCRSGAAQSHRSRRGRTSLFRQWCGPGRWPGRDARLGGGSALYRRDVVG